MTPEQASVYKAQVEQKLDEAQAEPKKTDEAKVDEAIQIATRIISSHPSAQVYQLRATGYVLKKDHTAALLDMDAAIELDPNPETYVESGILALTIERYVEAHYNFTQAIELDPNNPNYYLCRSVTFSTLESNPQRALDDLAMVFKLSPDKNTECAALKQRAELRCRQIPDNKQRIDAFTDLTLALEICDDLETQSHIKKMRAVLANEIGEFRLAYYDLSGQPPEEEHYKLRSTALSGLGFKEEASKANYIAALFQEMNLDEKVERAISKLTSENFDDALTLLTDAVSLLQEHKVEVPEPLFFRGLAAWGAGKLDDAIADFAAANDADRPFHNNLDSLIKSLILENKEEILNYEDGIPSILQFLTEDYELLSKRDFKRSTVCMAEAILRLNAGSTSDSVRARAYLNAALEFCKSPANPLTDDMYCLRAITKARMDDSDAAILDFDKAIELQEGDQQHNPAWSLYYMRGLLHAKLGAFERALADISTATPTAPERALLPLIHFRVSADIRAGKSTGDPIYAELFEAISPLHTAPNAIERLQQLISNHDLSIQQEGSTSSTPTEPNKLKGGDNKSC